MRPTAVLEDEVDGAWLNGSTNGAATETRDDPGPRRRRAGPDRPDQGPPRRPITVDQALFQMELVGHDFYLFNDADTQLCSVVYRRKGFDYGLLRLT